MAENTATPSVGEDVLLRKLDAVRDDILRGISRLPTIAFVPREELDAIRAEFLNCLSLVQHARDRVVARTDEAELDAALRLAADRYDGVCHRLELIWLRLRAQRA